MTNSKRSDDFSELAQAAAKYQAASIGGKAGSIKIDKIDLSQNIREIDKNSESFLALKESIQERGLLQRPIVLRKEDGDYLCIGGHRRIEALRDLGHIEIPCILHDFQDDEKSNTLVKLSENVVREAMNPIDLAESIKKVSEEVRESKSGLGRLLGKERSYITWMLKISDWPQDCKDFARSQGIPLAKLFAIAKKKDQTKRTITSALKKAIDKPKKTPPKRRAAVSLLEVRDSYFEKEGFTEEQSSAVIRFLRDNNFEGWF